MSAIGKYIRNCPWGYKCEKGWNDLLPSSGDGEDIRFCNDCQKKVFFCGSREDLAEAILLNRCACFPEILLTNDGTKKITYTAKDMSHNPLKALTGMPSLPVKDCGIEYLDIPDFLKRSEEG